MIYFNPKYDVCVINISKNGSSSLEKWLLTCGFKKYDNFKKIGNYVVCYHVLRNPIKRFASGLVEAFFTVNNDEFQQYTVNESLMSLSQPAIEEFCLHFITKLDFNRGYWPGFKNLDKKTNFWKDEPHMRAQCDYLSVVRQETNKLVPISFEYVPNFGHVLYKSIDIKNKTSLISEPIEHLNQSNSAKKYFAETLSNIMLKNWDMTLFDPFRNHLKEDIKYWNDSIKTEFMNKYNKDEHIRLI